MVNKAICNEINRAADQCSKFISGDNPLIYYSTIKSYGYKSLVEFEKSMFKLENYIKFSKISIFLSIKKAEHLASFLQKVNPGYKFYVNEMKRLICWIKG